MAKTYLTTDQLGAGTHRELQTPDGNLRVVGSIEIPPDAGAELPPEPVDVGVNVELGPRSTDWYEVHAPGFALLDGVVCNPKGRLPPGVMLAGCYVAAPDVVFVGLANVGDSSLSFSVAFALRLQP